MPCFTPPSLAFKILIILHKKLEKKACKSKNQSQLSMYIRPQYLLAVKLNRFTIGIKVVMTSHRKRGQQMLDMDAD